MRSAREFVEPGDLVAVNFRRRLSAGVAKKWTVNNTFQFFLIRDYRSRFYGPETLDKLDDYLSDDSYFYTSYITARIDQRVVPISEEHLNEFEQRYYEIFKEHMDMNQ